MSQPVVMDTPATGVSRITLNRPEKRNALDIPTRQALYAAIDVALDDADCRVVILRGAAAIASGPSMAYGLLKQGLGLAGPGLDAVLEFEAVAQATCLCGPEFDEGLRAFLEKRPAVFP